ncbi:MAG: RNA polymerase sigma factor RpoD/SigA [Candidatus Latescibacterota bacterium]|jgi:RNA polymerase primary sigma factor
MQFNDPLVARYFDEIAAMKITQTDDPTPPSGADAGDTVNELVRRNLRFVIRMAKRYRGMGLPFADLIGEGNLGLIHAARRYDPGRGVRFISYAVWWIRHAILKALAEHTGAVRPPTTMSRARVRLGRTAIRLEQRLGRLPQTEELAEALELKPEEVEDLKRLERPDLSLSSIAMADGTYRPEEFLADPSSLDGERELLARELQREIHQAVAALPSVEMQVVSMYFGLGGAEPMTLEQIGAHFSRSRERIRQVKRRAMSRLRTGSRGSHLRAYFTTD